MDNEIKIKLIIIHRNRHLVECSMEPFNIDEARMIYRELQNVKNNIIGNEIGWILRIYWMGMLAEHQVEEINSGIQ